MVDHQPEDRVCTIKAYSQYRRPEKLGCPDGFRGPDKSPRVSVMLAFWVQ